MITVNIKGTEYTVDYASIYQDFEKYKNSVLDIAMARLKSHAFDDIDKSKVLETINDKLWKFKKRLSENPDLAKKIATDVFGTIPAEHDERMIMAKPGVIFTNYRGVLGDFEKYIREEYNTTVDRPSLGSWTSFSDDVSPVTVLQFTVGHLFADAVFWEVEFAERQKSEERHERAMKKRQEQWDDPNYADNVEFLTYLEIIGYAFLMAILSGVIGGIVGWIFAGGKESGIIGGFLITVAVVANFISIMNFEFSSTKYPRFGKYLTATIIGVPTVLPVLYYFDIY
jgi:hypothetical protein